jgi:hypothetical protein
MPHTAPVDWGVLERLLPTVRKPGRYVGGEYNSIIKDWQGVSTRVCLAFPDIYDLGMSNLGLAILYDTLNALPDVLAERVYLPWTDMIAAVRAAQLPLYSLETRHPLAAFDILGFTLPYELHLHERAGDARRWPGCRCVRCRPRRALTRWSWPAAMPPSTRSRWRTSWTRSPSATGRKLVVELVRALCSRSQGEAREEQQLRALAARSQASTCRACTG